MGTWYVVNEIFLWKKKPKKQKTAIPISIYRFNLREIIDLNVRANTIRLLKGNI